MTKPLTVSEVAYFAALKFGPCVACMQVSRGYFRVGCQRDNPALPEAPYMTIRAYRGSHGGVAFEHGHYDLTHAQLSEVFPDVVAL